MTDTAAPTPDDEGSAAPARPAASDDAPRRFGPLRREIRAFLELFALCGLAVAQPTFDLLGKNTGIFATRGATSLDLILLSLAIVILPPLALWIVEVLIGLALPKVRRYAHAVLLAIPFGIFVEEILKRTTDLRPVRLVHLGVLAGLASILLWLRVEWSRLWLRYLAIAPALFAVLFLFASPASAIVFGGDVKPKSGVVVKDPKRVVVVTFDEFPTESLLDGTGRVDAELYPNFARLEAASTWYRNDTTVAPYTERAVPAILTGRMPPKGDVVPSADDYPQNLFTMLGGALPLNVHEAVTSLCPKSLCAATATQASGTERMKLLGGDAVTLWKDFASPKPSTVDFSEDSVVEFGLPQMNKFLASLQPGSKPQLDFVHIELPHEPWHLNQALQSNERFAAQQGASKLEWQKDEWPAASGRQQHLLQVQAADTALGKILDKLESTGAWKDSMVVVTADHGVAFTPLEGIRSVTDENGGNYDQILWTPLFIKYPGQTEGTIDDRPAQSIDIFPTIADVLKAKIPWKVDGVSLLGPVRPEFQRPFDQTKGQSFASAHALYPKDGQRYLLLDPSAFRSRVLTGRAAPAGGDPGLRIYRAGPYSAVLGEQAAAFAKGTGGAPTLAHLGGPLVAQFRGSDPPRYDVLDPKAAKIPWAYFAGLLDNTAEPTWVAIALNGRIVGIGQANPLQGTQTGVLTTVLAPQLVQAGPNQLQLYAISGDPQSPTLTEIPVYRGPGE